MLKKIGATLAFSLFAALAPSSHAATFETFVDDMPGFMDAIGHASVSTTEDFSSVVADYPVSTDPASPDSWNGFTVSTLGAGTSPWGASKYCAKLNALGCVDWNSSTPGVPGIYGGFAPDVGLSIKPASNNIAGFSFDFIDWNDLAERSYLVVSASDGTEVEVHGTANPSDHPPQTFAVTLSPTDLAAGRYITEIRWVSVTNPMFDGEVVGFYNFKTYTNPNIQPVAVPTLGHWTLLLSAALLAALGAGTLSRKQRHRG